MKSNIELSDQISTKSTTLLLTRTSHDSLGQSVAAVQQRERRPSKHPFSPRYYPALVVALLLPILLGSLASRFEDRLADTSCLPNGEYASPGSIKIWNIETMFSITVGMGRMSFASVKIIDLCWDVLIGRVGQAVLVWTAYKAFTRIMICSMEYDGVTCDTYAAVAFHTGTLYGTWTILVDFVAGRFPRSAYSGWAYGVMILAATHIVAWPTLASAMTSYGPVSVNHVAAGSVAAPRDQWRRCWGFVADASRVGLEDGYILFYDALESPNSTTGNLSTYWQSAQDGYMNAHAAWEPPWLARNITDFTGSTDLDPLRKTSEIWIGFQNYTLPSPLLDIVMFRSEPPDQPSTLCFGGVVITDAAIQSRDFGSCTPTDYYQWGFSFLLLFVATIVNAAVALLLWLIYTQTYRRSPLEGLGRYTPDLWRAVVDLSCIAHAQCGEDVYDLETEELKTAMKGQWMTLKPEYDQVPDVRRAWRPRNALRRMSKRAPDDTHPIT